jgi:diguanylate cyclase (GGDEF)-like protein/PAS domain S-box-containing protein
VLKNQIKFSAISSLVISFLLVAFSAFLRTELLSDLGLRLTYITFFPAVFFSALIGGLGGGLLATLLSGLFVTLWRQPDGQQFVNDSLDWIGLGIFTLNGIAVSVIVWKLMLAKFSGNKARSLFSNILENAPTGMHIATLDGHILQSNRAMREIVGFQKEELENLLISDLTHPEDRNISKENFERLLNGEKSVVYEKRYLHKNGSPVWVQVSLSLEEDDEGIPLYFIGQVEDISARKQAESLLLARDAEILEGQMILQSVLNHMPAMIGYWNRDLTNKFGNQAYQEWFGIPPEQLRGKHIREVLGEKLYRLNQPYIQAVLKGETQLFERIITDASGRQRHTQTSYLPDIIEEEQVSGFFVLVTDITQLKTAEQRIIQSEATLRAMYDNLPFLAWMKDTQGRYIQANKVFIKNTGLTCLEDLNGKTDFDFWPQELAEHYRAVDDEVIRTRQRKKLAEKILTDGHEHWVETFKSPVIDDQERVLGTIGLARDITGEREIDEKLNLAASIYDNSSEGMLITDEENRIIAVNSAFTQITGYSAEEVAGKNPRIFSSGMHDKAFYKEMWNSINTHGFWQGEICDRKKNGETHFKRLTINVLLSPEGKIYRHVALFSDITHIKKNEALIWHQANYDALTDLPNRRLFLDRLEQEINKAHRSGASLAVLFIDLDRFKEVNDTLGHQSGDTVLVEAAKRIEKCVRSSDTVSRLGGDEFMVLLTDLDDHSHVEGIAEKILLSLSEPLKLGTDLFFTSGSIGITLYPNDAKTSDELIKNADQAMYVSKNGGRNRFSYFTSEMQERAQARLKLASDLRRALDEKQFSLFYQPIIDLRTQKIHKAEALIRWSHPVRGLVTPADFIPFAEETGLIVEIGEWIFEEAANFLKEISRKTRQPFQISVNKSPVQFHKQLKGKDWVSYLHEIGVDPKQIVVEITEGLLLDGDITVKNRLLEFRDAGIEVAIDDFGTGYSSLSYLNKFGIDYLKIDQSFIRNLRNGSSEMAISEAIIVMAHKLGLKVIAEGVETEEQRDLLVAAECDFVQGYLYSKPLSSKDFEELLTKDLLTVG